MEKEKRIKMIVFLVLVIIVSLTLGVLGFIKSLDTPNEKSKEITEENTIEQDISLPKAYYKLLKLTEGMYENSKFGYNEETKTLSLDNQEIDKNVEEVKLYSIDSMILVTYKKGTLDYISLYDKEYNIITNNEKLIQEYKDFYLYKYTLNERGLIFYTKSKNDSCDGEKEKVIQVVYFLKYDGKDRFSSPVDLDVKTKDC